MKQVLSLFILAAVLGSSSLYAQRFNPYLALGGNLTGDYLTESGNSQVGTRLGLNLGPGVAVLINKRWEANLEMLYSQNGFYTKIAQVPAIALNNIKLHYVEVPITMSYRFNIKNDEQASFYKRSISGGIAYARLFHYKIKAVDGTDVSDEVRFDQENALLFNVSATSYFKEALALNGRGTLSTFGEWTIALRLLYYI